MKARDLLNPGESAIALFTRGMHLQINPDGAGRSGRWRVDPSRIPDRAIIYVRPVGATVADVLIASVTGTSPTEIKGRYTIHLSEVRNLGSTTNNWKEFAEGSQNPVRYLDRGGYPFHVILHSSLPNSSLERTGDAAGKGRGIWVRGAGERL